MLACNSQLQMLQRSWVQIQHLPTLWYHVMLREANVAWLNYVCKNCLKWPALLKQTKKKKQKDFKAHKHEFFFTFLAETQTLWSQGPVTRDF